MQSSTRGQCNVNRIRMHPLVLDPKTSPSYLCASSFCLMVRIWVAWKPCVQGARPLEGPWREACCLSVEQELGFQWAKPLKLQNLPVTGASITLTTTAHSFKREAIYRREEKDKASQAVSHICALVSIHRSIFHGHKWLSKSLTLGKIGIPIMFLYSWCPFLSPHNFWITFNSWQ